MNRYQDTQKVFRHSKWFPCSRLLQCRSNSQLDRSSFQRLWRRRNKLHKTVWNILHTHGDWGQSCEVHQKQGYDTGRNESWRAKRLCWRHLWSRTSTTIPFIADINSPGLNGMLVRGSVQVRERRWAGRYFLNYIIDSRANLGKFTQCILLEIPVPAHANCGCSDSLENSYRNFQEAADRKILEICQTTDYPRM